MQRIGQAVQPICLARAVRQPREQQAEHAQLFVKRRARELGGTYLFPCPVQNLLHAVDALVLLVQLEIVRKIARHAGQLQILFDHLPVDREAERLIGLHQLGQVLPAARGDELHPVRSRLDAVEVVPPDLEIGQDRAVDAAAVGVFLPDREILLHVDALDAVERDHVELAHGFVVLGRVARRHDHPALGQALVAEGLALQKLQHHGRECLRDAVDLVEEQDALLDARAFHLAVDRGDDLAHGVGRDRVFLPAELLVLDVGQAERGLARVVGQRIGHQPHMGLVRDLLHDLGLADARRAHEQGGALTDGRDAVRAELVAREIGAQRVFDLVFGSFDVHKQAPCSWLRGRRARTARPYGDGIISASRRMARMPQGGTFSGYASPSSMTKAASYRGRFFG